MRRCDDAASVWRQPVGSHEPLPAGGEDVGDLHDIPLHPAGERDDLADPAVPRTVLGAGHDEVDAARDGRYDEGWGDADRRGWWPRGNETTGQRVRDMLAFPNGIVGVAVGDAPSLGQLIWLVRRELEWARQVDEDHPLQFEVGVVELEAALEVSDARSKGGGLDLTVLGVGAKGELSKDVVRGTTATVRVTFTPNDRRTPGAKYAVSAADTEPPPRRASVGSDSRPPDRVDGTDPSDPQPSHSLAEGSRGAAATD